MLEPTDTLDAPKELQDWFAESRLKLSNRVVVEIRLPTGHKSHLNEAVVGLSADNIVCSIALSSGRSIDHTILAYTKAAANYAAIEYIVLDVMTNSNLKQGHNY